ncbi:alanine racemase [bacterium]|nr:alanine racemase [bacterium]
MEKRAWVEIDISDIRKNIQKIKKYTGKKFMACIKCNCYGMGMNEIGKPIEKEVDFFGVACLEEGISLRECGIKKPILILGTILPGDVEEAIMNDIAINLCNYEVLKKISEVVKKRERTAKVHIKVDTGMGRLGIKPEQTKKFIEEILKIKGIKIEGIFSHFATAEWRNKEYAKIQMERFKNVLKEISSVINIPLKHIANSAAILNLPESYKEFDMIRIGLLLLGVYPEKYLAKKLPLKTVLKGFSRIIYIKEVPSGFSLSYGLSFTTKRKTKVATLGIGYGDGLRRFLSNKFYLKWKNEKVKIIGNICMDQTLVDVTGKSVKIGDKIQIFGENFEIEDMAKIGGTVPQEILCGFGSARVKKIYKNG